MRYRIVDVDALPSMRLVAEAATLERLRDVIDWLIRERDARPSAGELLAATGTSEFARVVGEACDSAAWDEWYGETGGES